jgi:catechol 2,3-dioxygenase-like lactoylglutathione lyase family enzyme
MRVAAATFSSPDARALAAFYARLLGWTTVDDRDGWARVRPPGGGAGLSFHHEDLYVAPVWPSVPDGQRMTMHLDIAVEHLDTAVAWALHLGASQAEHQPQPAVRVMLDPDGHPFCLFEAASRGEFDTVDWHGAG